MAKARKSLFGSKISKEEVAREAKAVERKVMGTDTGREAAPPAEPTAKHKAEVKDKPAAKRSSGTKAKTTRTRKPKAAATPKKKETKVRRKFLYVDEPHHRAAKVKAIQQGISLSDYIEGLIAKDAM